MLRLAFGPGNLANKKYWDVEKTGTPDPHRFVILQVYWNAIFFPDPQIPRSMFKIIFLYVPHMRMFGAHISWVSRWTGAAERDLTCQSATGEKKVATREQTFDFF